MADRAASVLARLRNQANLTGRSFQLCLQLFCQEEFLRRLASSVYTNKFVLKGGHLIYCLTDFSSRPTVDIDFLARDTTNTIEALEGILANIINTPTGNDFIAYKIRHIEQISIDKKFPGLSAVLEARIKNTKTPVKIDFGFGDIVYPEEQIREVPTQLSDFAAPIVKTYSLETIVAEKLDAILDLMEFSSRMKDYYDLYYLSLQFNFDGCLLRTALVRTFANRERSYQRNDFRKVIAFDCNEDMQKKWDAFIKRMKLPPIHFDEVIAGIAAFLEPVWDSIYADDSTEFYWRAQDGMWKLDRK
jgi:predicted nucleotidyltransferase component of viral defense system